TLMLVLALLGTLSTEIITPGLLGIMFAASVTGATYWLVRLQRRELATTIFLYGMVLYVSLMIYLTGAAGPTFVVYLVPIMVAGLLGKGNDGARLFLVSLTCYVLLAF